MEDEKDQKRPAPSLAMFGTSLTVGSAVLILAGYWMDRRSGGGHKWTLVGLLLALVYVVYETWKLTRLLAAIDRKRSGAGDKSPGPPPGTPAP